MTDTRMIKCLQLVGTGQLFAYTDELAQRADMVPYDGPVQTGQSPDVLASQRTLEDNVAESNRKVEAMLRETQGELDRANIASAQERQQYQSENEALRARIAELESRDVVEPTAAPTPTATLADPPEGMHLVGTSADGTPQYAEDVPTPESTWTVPEGAEVIEHTATPVLVTDAAPVSAAPTSPPIAQPVAAPIAQPTTSVLPPAAADVASALQ